MGADGTDTPKATDSQAGSNGPDLPAPALARDEGTSDDLVRTDVHTAAEVETVMRGGVDPEALVSPPLDDQGSFADKPGQVHAEGLADVPEGDPWKDPDTPLGGDALTVDAPLDVSPADAATAAQGDLTHYPGVDQWTSNVAHEGDRVWFASHELPPGKGGPPGDQRLDGKSGFGVPEGGLHDGQQEVALNAARYNEGAQVEPHLGSYRGYLDCYEFAQDTPVATGVAAENTRYGDGGTPQIYVPDAKQLIADGKLRYVGTAQLEGTAASGRVRTDSTRGRAQVDLHLDEATPETDAAASSPGNRIAADSTPARDEDHALAADPPQEPRDHRHAENSGASRLRTAALVIGEIGSVLTGAGLPDSISTAHAHADQPTISQGIAEEHKIDVGNGFEVHQVSDTATVEPAPPKGKDQPDEPPESLPSLPEHHRDQFPRAQNSPKGSDQVPDKRPTPTGRGQSRGRPR